MMATGIEWTDETWNPVTGCSKVGEGCRNCYALRHWPRLSARGMPYDGRKFTDVAIHENRLDAPLHWRRPRRVFVNSMGDLFHEAVPDAFIDAVFNTIASCPQHIFQILTKRPQRMLDYAKFMSGAQLAAKQLLGDRASIWPLKNVWLGVSIEDQATADERVPLLLSTPAAVRFVSAEPLLEAIDIRQYLLRRRKRVDGKGYVEGERPIQSSGQRNVGVAGVLDWTIVGGESGPRSKIRPMEWDWVRAIVHQCQAARVPVFVKQGSADMPGYKSFAGFPADLRVREYPQ